MNQEQIKTHRKLLKMVGKYYPEKSGTQIFSDDKKALTILKVDNDTSIIFEAQPFRDDEAMLVFRAFFLMKAILSPELVKAVEQINKQLFFGSMNLLIDKKGVDVLFKYSVRSKNLTEELIRILISEIIVYFEKFMPDLIPFGVKPSENMEAELRKITLKN